MKSISPHLTVLCGASLLLALAHASTAQVVPDNSAFTYQGHLSQDGLPGDGLYDFEVQLFDGPGAGAANLTAVFPYPGVQVTGGLFVLSLDFGDGVFSGPHRYLEIKVRASGAGGAFTTLAPRQRLTSAPNAIYAEKAGTLQAGISSTLSGTLTFNPASGPPFLVSSNALVPNLNADFLDGLSSSAFVKRAGDTMTGTLTVTRAGGGGTATLSNVGSFFGNDIAVSGTASSGLGLGVSGSASGIAGTGVIGQASGDGGTGVYGSASAAAGANGKGIHGVSSVGLAGLFDGAVRINYASPFSKPQLEIEDPADTGFARIRMQTGTQQFWDVAVGGEGAANNLRFFRDGSGDVMWITPTGQLHTRVVTIMGGADIAEPFEMSEEEELPKGTVVVIDEERPGQLKESREPYDTRVAGVISGAGGVRTGLQLQQEGVLDGGQPVALTGRVYVQTTAANGPIKPGDLLTTSGEPGHAMKVTDHTQAQGAILGKAMTRLEEGTGLVLVLVTLQ